MTYISAQMTTLEQIVTEFCNPGYVDLMHIDRVSLVSLICYYICSCFLRFCFHILCFHFN